MNSILPDYLFQENKSYGSKKPFAFILWCTRSHVEHSTTCSIVKIVKSLRCHWDHRVKTCRCQWHCCVNEDTGESILQTFAGCIIICCNHTKFKEGWTILPKGCQAKAIKNSGWSNEIFWLNGVINTTIPLSHILIWIPRRTQRGIRFMMWHKGPRRRS